MPTIPELSPQVIMGVYEKFGSFANPFAQYFPPRPNPIVGPTVQYDIVTMRNQLARFVAREAPAPRMEGPTRNLVVYEALTLKESLKLPPEFVDIRRAGSISESGREAEVARAIRQIRLDFDRRIAWLEAQWLTFGALLSSAGVVPNTAASINGTVYLDYSSSKSANPMSVNLQIDSDHCDLAVAASWATTTTDIRGDIDAARIIVEQDSGVSPRLVLLNSNTMNYILKNDDAQLSVEFNNEVNRLGSMNEFRLWGYTFRPINDQWTMDADTMASGTSTAYYIPNNLVILMPEDADLAGRSLLECSPSDWNAPPEARGLYAFEDEEERHPHGSIPGLEWTGGPALLQPDAHYVFTNVTQT